MAKGRIQGITIEVDGDTKGLNSALKSVNTQSTKLTSELKDVEKLLKFNPGNVEALAQKQQLLTKQIETTTQKLNQLKQAESQVEAQFKSGEIGEEQYRAFRREIEYTEGALNGYKGQLNNIQVEQEKLGQNTKRINTLFDATGSSVDDFADILGGRLTNAIRNGTATSDQLEEAINKIGRAALGTDVDVGKMKNALDTVDDGKSIQNVQVDLKKLSEESDGTGNSLKNMMGKMDTAILLEGAEAVQGVTDKVLELGKSAFMSSLELDSATNKFNNNFGLTGKAAEKTKDSIVDFYNTGLVDSYEEAGEALIQTKRQLQNLNDTDLNSVTEKSLAFSKTFDADMTESLRGANALMETYGMTGEQAFDLMTVGARNSLNKTDELGDNLAEYASQFEQNGYSAQGMFEALDAGLQGGAYNLDKVNDLVKEFGIRISDDSIGKAVEGLGGKWKSMYDDMKKSGMDNNEIFASLATEINKVGDEQEKASIVSAIFGSLGEDNTVKVITAMGDLNGELGEVQGKYDDVKGASDKLTEGGTEQNLTKMWHELQTALMPIGEYLLELANAIIPKVVSVIQGLKKWFDDLSPFAKTLLEFIGLFVGLIAVITPIVIAVVAIIGVFMLLGSTVGLVIAAIAAVIAGVILIIKNWGKIVEWLKGVWETISEFFSNLWEDIKQIFSDAWEGIKQWFIELMIEWATWIYEFWNGIAEFFANIWNGLKEKWMEFWDPIINWFKEKWELIRTSAAEIWQSIVDTIVNVWDGLMEFLDPIISLISSMIEGAWMLIVAATQIAWAAFEKFILDPLKSVWKWVQDLFGKIVEWVKTKWEELKLITKVAWILFKKYMIDPVVNAYNYVKGKFSDLINWIKTKWELAKAITAAAWSIVKEKMISPIVDAYNKVKNKISDMINSIRTKFEDAKAIAKEKFNDVKKAIVDPIEKAKESVKNIIEKIKSFFTNLKLKIPKPSMPDMPHFSLKTSSKKIFGKEISYPSGLNVEWYAKGGILTKPTMFGMNGSSAMVGGEAGNEAVLPLNAKNLGVIGKMIAETMPQNGGDTYDLTVNVNGNVDKKMIDLMKKEMQKILIEQTRRKDSSMGGVTI
ncbi:phage tail tape measure protein [Listeria monocytogenes]|uniref:phage tail tape measure protein n=1 Tax=Listeria monocytogenes TaxID=1639 RepID=UPI00085C4F21|nr:phage tail tape measure protein [Listeria monocytogenes]EAG6333209.1 phage tail protein [Listeria monocytogenes CFSAN002346]EAG6373345.1 phage tail protein [Listeria monocytogenes CFSAN002356]EAC5867802.1 phage tail protein [Listeria monocytogenes]EAG1787079.1 phage tail protein [Listeria monocytogenes]EBA3680763.1 phage tail protein [Listeria monocytogenes]